ncbi:MAG: VWA domain-containing protein, partial [Polyangiaceae bacterium]
MTGMLSRTLAAGAVCVGLWVGCAASGTTPSDDDGPSGPGSGGSGAMTTTGGAGPGPGSGGSGGLDSCATFQAAAEQAPAAMLFVLDASISMSTGGKWQAAQLAIANAIDKDVFDTMSLGLVSFPTAPTVEPPPCICQALMLPHPCKSTLVQFGGDGVTCGYSALPQVAIGPAGDKTNGTMGARKSIYDYLVATQPFAGGLGDDGSPVYEAISSGYAALSAYPDVEARVLVLISDGGFSCTSLGSQERQDVAFEDANGCKDWEHPNSVNTLIAEKRDDPNTPINTFIVGVPGSDSTGQPVGGYDTPPYSMLLALSTYAATGSPNTLEPCDSGLMFSETAPAPGTPCHFDLSQGQLDPNALADALTKIRGQALGCVYQLPAPPPGETIAPDQVN